jgi:hypothetical protein
MQAEIIFIKDGANSAFGGFTRGGRARVSLELAKHFVDVAEVAVFASRPAKKPAVQAEPTPEPVADAQKQRGRQKKHP